MSCVSCTSSSNPSYDIATVNEWNGFTVYHNGEVVKMGGTVYIAKTTMTVGVSGFGFTPQFLLNIGYQPPNPSFFEAVPASSCYNSQNCTVLESTPAPTAVEPTVISTTQMATGESSEVFPTTPPENVVIHNGGVGGSTYFDEEDTAPPPPPFMASLPSLSSLELPDLPEIETKHLILGLAGVLTLILVFKR